MASDVPLRSARLPSQQQVVELLEADFARAGYDVEDVVVDARTQPPRIVVVVDGDDPPDLDAIAELSRAASELLDGVDSSAYVLEITSPGVDRPLTAERHFRRARGRRVELTTSDGEVLTARLGPLSGDVLQLVVGDRGKFSVREVPFADVERAVVQVEFSRPSQREMELAGGPLRNESGEPGREADA